MIASPIRLAAARLENAMQLECKIPLGHFDVNDARKNARVGKLRTCIKEFNEELAKVGRDIAQLPPRDAPIQMAGQVAFSFSDMLLRLAEREAIRLEIRAYGGVDEEQFQSIDFDLIGAGLDHELLTCADVSDRSTTTELSKPSKKVESKRGRPRKPSVDSGVEADRRLYEAWKTDNYRCFAELDLEKGIAPGEAKLAVDRHRKRLEKIHAGKPRQAR